MFFLVIGIFDPFSHIVNGVSVESIGIDGTKVTMAKPKLSGFRKDGRAYTVTADKALQDLKAPTLVQLIAVHADLGTPSDGDVTLTGREGLYDTAKEHMDITGDVRIHSARYDVKMEEASVQFKGGRYETHHPITIVLSDGSTIRADEAVAVDNGHELTFSGHVRTVMQPQPQAAQAEAKGEMRSGEQ